MENLKMHSPNLTEENIARLAELFPNCVTESREEKGILKKSIDFDLLRQELADHIVEGPQERYRLDWPGKREALLTANAPIAKTLRPCREESVDFDTTKNLFIEGDNLDALKLLQETYLGKVKMIYIDPPYNTGNDFIYEDDFAENTEEFLRRSNQRDEEGNRLVANTESNGRFHSDWLSMMYPRLKLARNLLSEDGVIFISIDDSEVNNLKFLMDEIFSETNHLVTHYIQVRYASKTLAEKNDYQKLIEQVLVYQKSSHVPVKRTEKYSLEKFCWKIVEKKAGQKKILGKREVEIFPEGHYEISKVNPSIDALKETWATGSVLVTNASGKYFAEYLAPRRDLDGLGTLYKVFGIGEDGIGFRYFTGPKRESATKGKFYSGVPTVRRNELQQGESLKPQSIPNYYDFSGSFGNCRQEGDTDFRGGKKPILFLAELINQAINESDNAIIMDFFSGSSSTAHAIMQLNAEDGGNRRFIMVQLPEPCDENSEAFKSGYKTIAEIGKERIRRAGKKIKEENPITTTDLDTGFRVLKVDSSNMADIYYTPDAVNQDKLLWMSENIKEDRTPEDLLFQVLLDWGVDLSLPVTKETIMGKDVLFVDGNALAACFDQDGGITEDLVREIARREPLRVVFRDAGFNDDSAKINVEQIFKAISPHTEVKTI
ncbi:MAG: site-specific DNA-methyltransferase [Thermovirgaceae bacterium]